MNALFLKDLAAKTRRGLEGRIRQGRCIGIAPYGYRIIRRLGQAGEPERGLREIDDAQAAVVRRIFADYATGLSPRSIARALNTEAVPGPGGTIWYDTAIRGRATRGDGLLRNPLYAGRLVWNRLRNSKDPVTVPAFAGPTLPRTSLSTRCPSLPSSTSQPGTACRTD